MASLGALKEAPEIEARKMAVERFAEVVSNLKQNSPP